MVLGFEKLDVYCWQSAQGREGALDPYLVNDRSASILLKNSIRPRARLQSRRLDRSEQPRIDDRYSVNDPRAPETAATRVGGEFFNRIRRLRPLDQRDLSGSERHRPDIGNSYTEVGGRQEVEV
jgi:hypothetical protein